MSTHEVISHTEGDRWTREVRYKDCKWWDYHLLPDGPVVKLTNKLRRKEDLVALFKDPIAPPPEYIFGFIYDQGHKRTIIFADGHEHNMILESTDEAAGVNHWIPPEGTVLMLAQLWVEKGLIKKISIGSKAEDEEKRKLALMDMIQAIDRSVFFPDGVEVSVYDRDSSVRLNSIYNPMTNLMSQVQASS